MAVEDSPNGVLSAYRAGCKVVMVPDQTQPDAELKKVFICLCPDSGRDQPPHLEVAIFFAFLYSSAYLTIRVTFEDNIKRDIACMCVIILTIRVTGTDMNKNSCKAAESVIDRTILRMAVAAGSLEKGQKGYGRNEF